MTSTEPLVKIQNNFTQMFHMKLQNLHWIQELWLVPTSFGNHGKPGTSPKKGPCMEKSWNLKKTE